MCIHVRIHFPRRKRISRLMWAFVCLLSIRVFGSTCRRRISMPHGFYSHFWARSAVVLAWTNFTRICPDLQILPPHRNLSTSGPAMIRPALDLAAKGSLFCASVWYVGKRSNFGHISLTRYWKCTVCHFYLINPTSRVHM